MRRAEADGDPRHTGDRLDDADELRRTESPAVDLESRCEVGDADSAAIAVDQLGDNGRGIADIVRTRLGLAFKNDIGEPFSSLPESNRQNTGSPS
jgi:hypothetical protein